MFKLQTIKQVVIFSAIIVLLILPNTSGASDQYSIDVGTYYRLYSDDGDNTSYIDNAWAVEMTVHTPIGVFIRGQSEFSRLHYFHNKLGNMTIYGLGAGYEYAPKLNFPLQPRFWGMVGHYWPHLSMKSGDTIDPRAVLCVEEPETPPETVHIEEIYHTMDYDIENGFGYEIGMDALYSFTDHFTMTASVSYRWLELDEEVTIRGSDSSLDATSKSRDFSGYRTALNFSYRF